MEDCLNEKEPFLEETKEETKEKNRRKGYRNLPPAKKGLNRAIEAEIKGEQNFCKH